MVSAPLVPSQPKYKSTRRELSQTSIQDKENITVQDGHNRPEKIAIQDRNTVQDPDVVNESLLPQTPAEKLWLADLIGTTEDMYYRTLPPATPADHVVWQHGPSSSAGSRQASIAASQRSTRKRKRAASSSPSSSMQHEKSSHFHANESPSKRLQGGSQAGGNNDPIEELLSRYMSTNKPRCLAGEIAIPTFERLFPSSPQTPDAASRDASFRRTHSCGIEWPMSSAKRQRRIVQENLSSTKAIFARSRNEMLAPGLPTNSRVSILMDTIQKSLIARDDLPTDAPSSSSPLPDKHSQLTGSPSKQHLNGSPLKEQELAPPDDSPSKHRDARAMLVQDESSDEFGDADLDDALLQAVEQMATQEQHITESANDATGNRSGHEVRDANSPEPHKSPMPEHEHDVEHPASNATLVGHQLVNNALPANPSGLKEQETSDDEFGLDDDDPLLNAMYAVAEQIDSQGVQQLPTEIPIIPVLDGQAEKQDVGACSDEFEDMYGEDVWNDIDDRNEKHEIPWTDLTNTTLSDNRTIKRYLVLDVFESVYENARGRELPEKLLSLKDERTNTLCIVCLRQCWYESRCSKGAYVHIVGDFDRAGRCIVDDDHNMIILHPDHLISATVVADAFVCLRRAALQDRVKATSVPSGPQVFGHILHEFFGEALRMNKWDSMSLRELIEHLLPNYLQDLYEIQVPVNTAIDHVMSKVPDLKAWAEVFLVADLKQDAVIHDRNGTVVPMTMNKLLELEEHVWSPMYGLKGNIDATVQVQMQLPSEFRSKTLTVPLEFKTGKQDTSQNHRAQTALYALLLSDRYDIEVTSGILYYLETSKTLRIQAIRNEVKGMLIMRNELAGYVHDKLALPPLVEKDHLCKGCYAKTACFTYHKLIDDGEVQSAKLRVVYNDIVEHLKVSHQSFFKKWDDLLTKEERDTMKFRRELWTMLSHERERVGRCFAEVMIEPGSAIENPDSTKINRYQYSFVKAKDQSGFSFAESQLTTGEPIVISDEKGHFALANGYVLKVHPARLTVQVDRRLLNARQKGCGFDPVHNQTFAGIMEVVGDNTEADSNSCATDTPMLYRIDKDEFANGMATARNNLIRLMEKDLYKSRELRQAIIDNIPPTFKANSSTYILSGPASQQDLNIDQRNAIEKVMSAQDYALVLGMPGTGKTTTIAHIIRALVSQNKSVLLTSYTHTAVDNILLKIKDDNIPILRLGTTTKVHPEVQAFADLGGIPKKTFEEIDESWHKSKVVATTCLGITHPIFNHRIFDYCIVDEASQITLPVCLGPIRMAKTFILVGDHYQLPPLVANKEAQEGGLNISLFKLLSDAQPSSVVNLEHQYRMAEDIMLLSNTLIYNGRLKCGNSAVATRLLHIPNLDRGLAAHHHTADTLPRSHPRGSSICLSPNSSQCWLRTALAPQSRCLFLNTDPLEAPWSGSETTSAKGSRITNPTEALLVSHLVTTLLSAGVPARSIGIITFYRSQLALLKHSVKSLTQPHTSNEIEMHTADKFQGRDKEVVILSCVRSNEANNVGELLRDWRRVNVAITRAKSKLLVVGNRRTLGNSGVPVLQGLVEVMDGKGWVLDLVPGTVEGHVFEEGLGMGTQRQSGVVGVVGKEKEKVKVKVERGGEGVARTPLKPTVANSLNVPTGGRRPNKVARGGLDVEKVLRTNPILMDVVHDMDAEDYENRL